ncbi:Na+/H+ antiporter NhaA [Nitrosomonas sp. Nm33]|uniref:Na+/H+ antiporter NhaA n=1 Tax=Nitrosomonas sp. Nm33 TaxID=133724 RepID=UPI0008956216|nr:Na+/H+ antiporter NhaA [Nitrosomonas sp. Nm33]SDZ01095.1 Na+:H+ antiporter, NhaA family [Nitrosomonas sp. Nm33]
MTERNQKRRLDPPVDESSDHVIGPPHAKVTIVEYGSYACPNCRAANEVISGIRDKFGDQMRYVFRHRPVPGNTLARRAAELVEHARDSESFWKAHMKLMTRSVQLMEEDLAEVAADLGLTATDAEDTKKADQLARENVDAGLASASHSGVNITPTFFINGRQYKGPWDQYSLNEAMLETLGYRVRVAAFDFIKWGPSAGALLLLALVTAVIVSNSAHNSIFEAFWKQDFGLTFGETSFSLSIQHWINDGLLTIFFLVVGLEIKREFTVGHLARLRSAILPIAAALGGMLVPALLYIAIVPDGIWSHGWGIPMATDTAFAVALIALMGRRVPLELRVFLTAAAIVDDIGAILVIAVFYSTDLQLGYLVGAAMTCAGLAVLNRGRIYKLTPYLLLGLVLWACFNASGVHATLAGIILAIFIPTRPPPNMHVLMAQANTIIAASSQYSGEFLRHGPSLPVLQALDTIYDRLESPAARLLRHAGARSSYLVLPLFALANGGVVLSTGIIDGREPLVLAILTGFVVGKPVGMVAASVLAVRAGIADKPEAYSWTQLVGAAALAGIGFTMSLFVAAQAFPSSNDLDAAKIAIFIASTVSAIIGVSLLWGAWFNSPTRQQ